MQIRISKFKKWVNDPIAANINEPTTCPYCTSPSSKTESASIFKSVCESARVPTNLASS